LEKIKGTPGVRRKMMAHSSMLPGVDSGKWKRVLARSLLNKLLAGPRASQYVHERLANKARVQYRQLSHGPFSPPHNPASPSKGATGNIKPGSTAIARNSSGPL